MSPEVINKLNLKRASKKISLLKSGYNPEKKQLMWKGTNTGFRSAAHRDKHSNMAEPYKIWGGKRTVGGRCILRTWCFQIYLYCVAPGLFTLQMMLLKGLPTPSKSESENIAWCFAAHSLIFSTCSLIFFAFVFAFARCRLTLRQWRSQDFPAFPKTT